MLMDIESLLAPIPGDNPAGENLRYAAVYSDIKEARRADDPLNRGDWQQELKTSDWGKVEKLAVDALTRQTKDLQIAAWLLEAEIKKMGFKGLTAGLELFSGLLTRFWDSLYPEMDDGDLDFRAAPIEFLNEKLAHALKEIPVTDPRTSPGYSWLKWQESRQVGAESGYKNQWGDVDEPKKQARDQKIAEGKIPAEEFDGAVTRSSLAFYESLLADINACRQSFGVFDGLVDEKFGNQAPRLTEFRSALEDCLTLIAKFHKDKGGKQHAEEAAPKPEDATPQEKIEETPMEGNMNTPFMNPGSVLFTSAAGEGGPSFSHLLPVTDVRMDALWNEALQVLARTGIKTALSQVMSAALSAVSIREQSRYRLIMAKLCLSAGRIDLARPIAEELYALVETLNLSQWESSVWIGEVIDTLYQCLTKGDDASDNISRARELLEKLCRTDVTKAMAYQPAGG